MYCQYPGRCPLHYPPQPSLYDRLGGVFAIAAVVNDFSDALMRNPVVGPLSKNPQLAEWSKNQAPTRLPGLKFQRTLWLCEAAGGPQRYVPTRPGGSHLGLENGHCPLRISNDEFDAVAAELGLSLDRFNVPVREKQEVLAAFLAHKPEVIAGGMPGARCPFFTRGQFIQ